MDLNDQVLLKSEHVLFGFYLENKPRRHVSLRSGLNGHYYEKPGIRVVRTGYIRTSLLRCKE